MPTRTAAVRRTSSGCGERRPLPASATVRLSTSSIMPPGEYADLPLQGDPRGVYDGYSQAMSRVFRQGVTEMAQTGAGSWDPGMRVGDADRERTVEQLREHHAAGRLTMDEFEERMRKAYDSKTYGDLAQLTRDLPIDLARIGPGADARARYQVQGRGPGGSEFGSIGGIAAMRFRRG